MFARVAIAALNHVLANEGWARERLRPFAGQHAAVTAGPLRLPLVVGGDGMFVVEELADEPAVVISLPADAPLRYLLDPTSVFASAKLSGSVDFAETLAFVFRNLAWDVEGDLTRVVGDILARRLALAGQACLDWQKKTAGNMASNIAEYVTEEAPVVTPKREIAAFCRSVDGLRDDLARLEKRLAKL